MSARPGAARRAAVSYPAAPAPPVLLPYQQAWVGDPADVAIWEKSRRIGASWCDAADSVLLCAAADGMDTLYIGYSQDMTREYIDDCAMWCRAFGKAAAAVEETLFEDQQPDGTTRHIKAFRIDFASGSKILALSSRPRSIRGKQGKVTIDEAAFHDDLDGLLTAALALLIWGGRVRLLSSHNGEDNPFNVLIKDVRAGKYGYSLHRTTFDDAIRAGLFERVRLVMGARLQEQTADAWRARIYGLYGDRASQELDCIPAMGSGVYIPRTLIERCQVADVPVLRWTKPDEWVLDDARLVETDRWIADVLDPALAALHPGRRSVYGQDFGRNGDLSVTLVLQDEGGGRWRAGFVLELRRIPFDVQAKIRDHILAGVPLLHHAKFDARGNGQSHAEAALQAYGPGRVECVMASASWYATHFPPYRQAYEDRSIIAPPGEDWIADHRSIVLDKGRPMMADTRIKGSDGEYRHGDAAIAGVLAWAAARTDGQPPAGQSIDSPADAYLPGRMQGRRRATMFRRT